MKPRACLLIFVVSGLVACTPTMLATASVGSPPATVVPTDTPVTPSPMPTTYVVAQGDNLSRIARSFGVSVADLVELNQIEDPNQIEVGQVLIIPTAVPLTVPVEESPATATRPPATSTPTALPTPTVKASATPSPTRLATATLMPTATRRPTVTPVPTLRRRILVTPRYLSATPTATVSHTPTARPTSIPRDTPTPRPSAPRPTASPTVGVAVTSVTGTPAPSATPLPGAAINGTPEDRALAAAMLEALAPYEVQRVVIADARDQGGARVAIGTLYLTAEQEKSEDELSLPLGAIFITAYRVVLEAGEETELDSVAVIIATSEGNAAALIGARIPDIAEFVEGTLSETEFVNRWVVRQF